LNKNSLKLEINIDKLLNIIFLIVINKKWRADHITSVQLRREVLFLMQRVFSKYCNLCRFPKEDLNAPRMRIVKK
jgi:hypothetical protein